MTILNKRFEDKYFPKVKAVIKSEVGDVIRHLQYYGDIQQAIGYVHKHIHSGKLPSVVEKMYQEVGLRYARRTHSILIRQRKGIELVYQTKGFGFNQQWVDFIKNYLFKFLLEKITFQVAETTRNVLLTVLNNAIEQGWGIDKTVQELEVLPLSSTQAARIVRTEITRAANTGVMAASSTFPFQQTKEWISAHDRRVRGVNPKDHANHVELDGQVIDEEDVFIDNRNGDRLRYPGDPQASAASTINCRCAIALVAKVDENGRLIPKRKTTAVIYPNQRRHQTILI